MAVLLARPTGAAGRRPAAALLALLLTAASGAGPAASLAAQEPADTARVRAPAIRGPEALARSLAEALDDPALARAHVGMTVRSADSGEVLYDRAGQRRFTTASTAKLVTAAVALERLGPGFRWTTRLAACGPVEDGVLRGDLAVVGSGDPTVDRAQLETWAEILRGAGIRRIAGDVVGDATAFPPPTWGRGWMWDDLHLGWAAGVDALQLADPAREVVLRPASRVGDPATAAPRDTLRAPMAPEGHLPMEIRVRTGPAGSELDLRFEPGPGPGTGGRITGWMPADRDSLVLSLAPRHPADRLLSELAGVLARSGPAVEGRFRRRDETGGPGAERRPVPCPGSDEPPAWSAASRSDSLGAVLAHTLGRSDNQAAESLLRTLGLVEGRAGTAAEGASVAASTLADWGVDPGAVTLADGAGLSRYDQAAPSALTRMLRAVWLGPHREVFLDALAAPDRSGTLHGRFRGVPARETLRAKTGSLSSVRALAGYVEAADGQTLAFALMLDGYHVPGSVAEALRDRVVERLALYRAE